MKRIPLLLTAILLAISSLNAQKANNPYDKNYTEMWNSIEKHVKNNLPESAEKELVKLEEKAFAEKNQRQMLKATLFRYKIFQMKEEGEVTPAYLKYAETMYDKLDKAHTAILKEEIAFLYDSYLDDNSWTIRRNKPIDDGTIPAEMKYWDESIFTNKINTLYREALTASDELKKLNTADYAAIMDEKRSENILKNVEFEPTMFDYVFHRIEKYYSSKSTADNIKSTMDTEQWWLPAKDFTKVQLGDDTDPLIVCLKIFQQLIGNTKTDENVQIYNDVKRFQFVNGILKEDDRFIKIIEGIYEKNSKKPVAENIACYLASQYVRTYSENDSTTFDNYNKALELCRNYKTNNDAISLMYYIQNKEISARIDKVALPNEPLPVVISYRNTDHLYYKILKLTESDKKKIESLKYNERLPWLDSQKPLKKGNVALTSESDYRHHRTIAALPELPAGEYAMIGRYDENAKADDDKCFLIYFQVSQLSFIQDKEGSQTTIYVLDRKTGYPVPDVKVECYTTVYNYDKHISEKKVLHTTKSDAEGKAIVKLSDVKDGFKINLFGNNDALLTEENQYLRTSSPALPRLRTSLFTDRAIYRPGQTVYFKGITVREQGDDECVVVDREENVRFLDANYQEISKLKLKTNKYGSFNGSFVIPTNLLNGSFTIRTECGSVYFRVEEYKRPTFEVHFDSYKDQYKLNQDITIDGSVDAYAGFSIDGAKCTYKVVRKTSFPCRWWWYDYPNVNDETIEMGETVTDENGKFHIKFNLRPARRLKPEQQPVFTYEIEVKATNPQGETHTSTHYIRAGYSDISLSTNIPGKVEKSELGKYKVSVQNMNWQPAKSKVKYTLYRYENTERIFEDEGLDRKLYSDKELKTLFPDVDYYNKPNQKKSQVAERTLDVDADTLLFEGLDLEQGTYMMEVVSLDDTLVKTSTQFTVFDQKSSKMPVTARMWYYNDKYSIKPGEKFTFRIGSSMTDTKVWVRIMHGNELREEKWITLDNNVADIVYEATEADRGGIDIKAGFVRGNKESLVNQHLSVYYDNLDLDVQLATVRDKLSPGEAETWQVTITDKDKKGVEAELLAGMYDASLDDLVYHYWSFGMKPSSKYSGAFSTDRLFYSNSSSTRYAYNPTINLLAFSVPSDYDIIVLYIPMRPYMLGSAMGGAPGRVLEKNSSAVRMDSYAAGVEEEVVEEEAVMMDAVSNDEAAEKEDVDAGGNEGGKTDENGEPTPKLRENFNETAFFYPNLTTDKKGNTTFSFTMPDAVTRWRLMMLAHNEKRQTGYKQYTFTSSRPVMIMPDMPRFVYDHDTLYLVANVINTGDESVTPKAKLEVFDALTMKPVEGVVISETNVSLPEIMPGRSHEARWKVAAPQDISLLAFRFTALCGKFSDAEQHILPVLSSEIFLTQTLPFTVKAETEKTFSFDGLANPGNEERDYALTLNFSANPVWYAVQSLPYLANIKTDRAETAFYVLYANTISSYIAKNIPNLINYIKKWQIETPDALMSQLQKDENLKAILLQETPWVLEAKSEAEQRSRIANLFDINNMSQQQHSCIDIIEKKQVSSGGWPWMDGMPESTYITMYILSGIGRLDKMNALDALPANEKNRIMEIANKAVRYIEHDVADYYRYMKHEKQEWGIGTYTLAELYALSFFKQQNSDRDFKDAKNYFMSRLDKEWTKFSFNNRSKAAVLLFRNGNVETAKLMLQSFKECAQKNEQIGMYWAKKYFSFDSHVATHANIMTAFAEIENDNETLDQLRVWLLTQKQTNMWENSASTAEAVYALLMRGSDWLHDSKPVTLSFADQKIDTDDAVAGTGFIQRNWTAAEITPKMHSLTVNNPTAHLVWGGLFRQYFVPIDKVKADTATFKIKRELFIENNTDKGVALTPIEKCQPKVGDKIVVRLTFEASQDMSFVFVKDLRAAGIEPIKQISSYRYNDGMSYYYSITDTFTGFYIDFLSKGVHRLEYEMYITKEGNLSNGYALIQCLYAPEFTSYSSGMRINVKNN